MIIDGKDISYWGVELMKGGFNPLFKYPARTKVQFSNYAEMDGIIPDLRKIEFEPKQVALQFMSEARSYSEFLSKYNRFFADMTMPGAHRILDLENGLTYKLRYDTTASYSMPTPFNAGKHLTSFSLSFIEDSHSIPDIQYPVGGVPLYGVYSINGIDFGNFGVHPDGEIGDVLKYPDMKAPFSDGKAVDHKTYRLKHKEVTLKLWMYANSEHEFVNNYSAFFNQFNRTGKQQLYIKEIDGVTEVYYTSCPFFEITSWGSRIGARMSLNLVIPVVTWLDGGGTTILTVLLDRGTNKILADEQGRMIVFNRR